MFPTGNSAEGASTTTLLHALFGKSNFDYGQPRNRDLYGLGAGSSSSGVATRDSGLIGSGAGDCAPAPSHTTGRAVCSHPAVERSDPLQGGRKV